MLFLYLTAFSRVYAKSHVFATDSIILFPLYLFNELRLALQQAGISDCKVISYEDKLAPQVKAKFDEDSNKGNALFVSHFAIADAKEIVELAVNDEDVHRSMEEKRHWATATYKKSCGPGEK